MARNLNTVDGLDNIRKARNRMENRIRTAVLAFQDDTGIYPTGIAIDLGRSYGGPVMAVDVRVTWEIQ